MLLGWAGVYTCSCRDALLLAMAKDCMCGRMNVSKDALHCPTIHGTALLMHCPKARMLELSEEEVKARAAAAQQEHMASNDLLTQVHTLGGDAQSR
jgi:hypothetical protein